VVDSYQTTSHVPEALHRLVESYSRLGLREEALRNAAVLGHNFPGSPWYQDTYRLVGDPTMPPADGEAKSGWFSRAVDSVF
jgi:outer membrane protein assembly factor BamD